MNKRFSDDELMKIIQQSVIYKCACPAQVCRAIVDTRKLHDYQLQCRNSTDTDYMVHEQIQDVAERNHAALEDCLMAVLKLEGWDLESLTMPKDFHKRMMGDTGE